MRNEAMPTIFMWPIRQLIFISDGFHLHNYTTTCQSKGQQVKFYYNWSNDLTENNKALDRLLFSSPVCNTTCSGQRHSLLVDSHLLKEVRYQCVYQVAQP